MYNDPKNLEGRQTHSGSFIFAMIMNIKKIIYTVQHTQSEHHVNGFVGAWGNWNLTEIGKEQARKIGEWLCQHEDCDSTYKLYSSDLKRAAQTSEEIQKSLALADSAFTKTPLLREINLGQGNGKPRDWYNAHVTTPPEVYDPDFRSFPDAENDRELWNRLYSFYEQLISCDDEKIIVVSHGGALSFLASMLIGDTFDDTRKRKIFGRSGSVSRFIIKADGSVEISYLNCQVNL